MLLSASIDYMISRGFDYEDGPLLNKTIRETRVLGCGGNVQIDSSGNDRKW